MSDCLLCCPFSLFEVMIIVLSGHELEKNVPVMRSSLYFAHLCFVSSLTNPVNVTFKSFSFLSTSE